MPIPKTRRAYLMLVAALWLAAEVESGGITQTTSPVQQPGVVTMPAAVPQLTFQLIAAFEQRPQNPAGRLLEVKPGVFLGVSTNGGEFSNGTVFVLFRTTSNMWTMRTVHSFSGGDGRNPKAGMIRGHDGNFYSTTSAGGAHDLGTVYRMTASGAVTTLYSFAGLDGEEPWAPLVLASDSTLWGTTYRGGAAPGQGLGTIFRITEAGTLTTVHLFDDGSLPTAGLIQASDGMFYGLTSSGGFGEGVAFRLTPAGDYTLLHRFEIHEESGVRPLGGLIQGSDGNFYGTTTRGLPPTTSSGAVFRMTSDGTVTALHTFPLSGGPLAETGLVQASDGALYGTTSHCCDENSGSVFRVETDGDFATLATLGGSFGTAPSDLIQASDGLLYGTTSTGELPLPDVGVVGFGTVFSLPTTGPATRLVTFSSDRPRNPAGRMIELAPGEFYGTTCRGGLYDNGTVFKLSSAGLQTLHSFKGPGYSEGTCPVAGLTLGPDHETLYGTTFWGGSYNQGTVFKITTAGELTTLHRFNHDDEKGVRPAGELAVGTDANLYGITSDWLGADNGNLFRISSGDGTVVAGLGKLQEGSLPFSDLVAATDGNLYGANLRNHFVPGGGLFRASLDGSITTLHSFSSDYRGEPAITVMQARDGNLYGTESSGGTSRAGSVFKSTLAGAVSELHSFDGTDGYNPTGRLFETASGFFGTTVGSIDGAHGFGTVFFMNAAGAVTTLHRFQDSDGANPYAGVIRAADGSLYGTTIRGGPGHAGVIYRIR